MYLLLSTTQRCASIFRNSFLFRMISYFGLISLVWSMKFPFVFQKIYAEDGTLFLSNPHKYRFPIDLLQPPDGYLNLIFRLGGRFVSLFPLEYAPVACALFAALCLSFLAAGLFQYNNFITQDFLSRFTLTLCFIFLPLSAFSALGNIANLYVFFMAASAVFLYHHESRRTEILYKSIVFFIAALSLPLTIFLLPIMAHRIYIDKGNSRKWKIQKSDIALLSGLILQFIFILFTTLGDRTPHSPNSLLKTFYLYLDRGIGSSTIPKWGFVSGTNEKIVYEGSIDLLQSSSHRLLGIIAVLTVILVIYFNSHKAMLRKTKYQFWLIALLSVVYSMLVGIFFEPEPRYLIFTSFLTCWAILLLLDSQRQLQLRTAVSVYLILVLAFGFTASSHRSQGPDWKSEIDKARKSCSQINPVDEVTIRTSPVDAVWEGTISCKDFK